MENPPQRTDEAIKQMRIREGRTLVTYLKCNQEVHLDKTYKIFLEEWFLPDWTWDQKFIGTPVYATTKAVQFKIDGELRWFPKRAIRKVEEVDSQ